MRNLTSWDSLQPLIGTTSEGADLDFKATLDPSKGKIEFAKDVAALANVLGGHVLVGVSTDMNGTRCTGFHGIDKELATEISKVFEEQVKDRCRPTPIFNVRSIGREGTSKVVVVISVEASPNAPIGVCLRQDKGGLLVDKGWAFPYRVGSLTEYLHPDQFGVYESMSARRAAAFLNSIPPTNAYWSTSAGSWARPCPTVKGTATVGAVISSPSRSSSSAWISSGTSLRSAS